MLVQAAGGSACFHASVSRPFGSLIDPWLVGFPGITGKTGIKTEEVDADNFDLVFKINTKGIFLFCKVCVCVCVCVWSMALLQHPVAAGENL